MSEQGNGGLQMFAIDCIERRESVRVDIEHRHQFAERVENRDDDLGARQGVAGDVPGKAVDIGHDLSAALAGGRSADATSKGNLEAPQWPLVWTNSQQPRCHHAVEAGPAGVGKSLMEQTSGTRHRRDGIAEASDDGVDLLENAPVGLVFLGGVHGRNRSASRRWP